MINRCLTFTWSTPHHTNQWGVHFSWNNENFAVGLKLFSYKGKKLIWDGTCNSFVWERRIEIYICKIIFVVSFFKEEKTNDLKPAETNSIWVVSCGVFENTCSLRASGKTLKNVFRFDFTKFEENLLKQSFLSTICFLHGTLSLRLFKCFSGKTTT